MTGAPLLRPEEYAVVFKALEDELREEDYFMASTSRAVRDRCSLRGHPVSRKDVSFILKGLTYGGHDFDEDSLANTAETFAQVSESKSTNFARAHNSTSPLRSSDFLTSG